MSYEISRTDLLFSKYLDSLVGRFYKILPLKEENNPTLYEYIESFKFELMGSRRLVVALSNDAQFMSLISTLQYFLDSEFDTKTCKREVMKCITISKKLKQKYFKAGVIE